MNINYLFVFFISLGLCLITFGISSFFNSAKLEKSGYVVDGTVVRMDTRLGNTGRVFIPVVHYIDHKNEIRELISNKGTNPRGLDSLSLAAALGVSTSPGYAN